MKKTIFSVGQIILNVLVCLLILDLGNRIFGGKGIVGLFVLEGGKKEQSTNTSHGNNATERPVNKKEKTPPKGDDKTITNVKPSNEREAEREKLKLPNELTIRNKVVGTYEFKRGENSLKAVFYEDGNWTDYENGKLLRECKWSIKDGEILAEDGLGNTSIFIINDDGNLVGIGRIREDGRRKILPDEYHYTLNKIK
jgi:hypothetical protein